MVFDEVRHWSHPNSNCVQPVTVVQTLLKLQIFSLIYVSVLCSIQHEVNKLVSSTEGKEKMGGGGSKCRCTPKMSSYFSAA